MFESGVITQNKDKKRKALLCAGLLTFIIGLLYVILTKGQLYNFTGAKDDIAPVSTFIKDVSQNVSEEMGHGANVINKK